MYFTSWDANTFLCLLSVFPEEVVRGMIKMVKKEHEEFVRLETRKFQYNLAPYLLYKNRMHFPSCATRELKAKWRWRCPEKRRESLVRWTGNNWDWRYSQVWKDPCVTSGKASSRAGYWNTGEAWLYSIEDRNLDTSEWEGYEEEVYFDMKERERKEYVGDWYKNIHEGRYFLFFKEHDILSSAIYDKYRDDEHSVRSICELGDRWQVAQDLLTLDGGGLGQSPGSKIEHIDYLIELG